MSWKKRTNIEIEDSVDSGDYTGGYKFFPWLWYMRKQMLFAILLNIFIGGCIIIEYAQHFERKMTLIIGLFFAVALPILIMTLLYREHREKQNGISR